MQQYIDVSAAVAYVGHRRGDAVRVGEVDGVVVNRATRSLDRLDRGERRVEAFDACEFTLDGHRGGVIACGLHPCCDGRFERIPVGPEGHQIRVVAVGCRCEVEQVEGAGRGGSEVRRDGGHDAARGAGDHDHRVRAERIEVAGGFVAGGFVADSLREGRFDERHAESATVGTSDLDAAGVAQRLFDQLLGDRRGLAALGQIDRLDGGVGALLLVRLGEADDRSAQRVGGAGVVVAVIATEPGGRDQERAGVVQVAHRRVQRLDPPAQRFAPTFEVVLSEVAVGVECCEPVDPGDRGLLVPRRQHGEQVVGRHTGRQCERCCARLGELLHEGIADAAFIEHHDHPGTVEFDTGGQASDDVGSQ